MNTDFWLQCWQRGEIGFHQDQPHAALSIEPLQHWLQSAAHIFVPLCGKSPDLDWFQHQGLRVSGVEISRLAIDAYIESHPLHWTSAAAGQLLEFSTAEGHRLWCGDFFDLDRERLGEVDLIYDRAALIALPPSMRKRYARRLQDLMPSAGILLITLEYDASQMQGPPFPVMQAEVSELFPSFQIDCIQRLQVLATHPGLQQRGLTALTEVVYRLQR